MNPLASCALSFAMDAAAAVESVAFRTGQRVAQRPVASALTLLLGCAVVGLSWQLLRPSLSGRPPRTAAAHYRRR